MIKNITLSLITILFVVLTFSTQDVFSADAANGKAKYDSFCATCHGATGKGDGVAAGALDPKPTNLCETKKSDAELKDVIVKGGAGTGLSPTMPAWDGVLSPAEIDNVLAHIKTSLCK